MDKKSNRNNRMSDYQSKHSTRISNQSSIVQYTKENYDKIRKEFEEKFGHVEPRTQPRSKDNYKH